MATIDIRTIKVLLDTNIPGKEIVPLTKSILYQPKMNTGKWNEYPFFTMDAEYPEGYLSIFTYEQQMEFFFVKQKMIETLRTKSNITERPNSIDLKTQDQITKEAKSSSEKALEIEKTKLEKEQKMKLIDENEKKDIVSLTTTKEIKLRTLESNTMTKLLGDTIKYKQDPSDKKYKFYVDKGSALELDNGQITTYDKFMIDYKNFFLEPMKKKLNDIITQKTITELFKLKPGKSCDNDDTEHIFEKPFTEIYETLKDYLDTLDDIRGIKYFENIPNLGSIIDEFHSDMNEVIIEGENLPVKPQAVNKILCDWKTQLTKIFSDHKTEIKQLLDGVERAVQTLIIKHDQSIVNENIDFGVKINEAKTKYQSERLVLDNTKSALGSPLESKEPKKMSRLEYEKERNRIGEKNMMIMIRLMFPTKYPLVGNIFSSFHSVVTGKNEFNLKWTDFIPSFFKKKVFEGLKDYSYLKIDGTVYTVTQAIWLNDIYNHKEYKQLVNQFEELQRWKDKEIAKNNGELMKRYKLFQQTYRTGTYELNRGDIETIRKTLDINAPEQGKSSITADRLNKYKTMVNGLIKALEQFLLAIQSETINKHAMLDNSTKFVELMTELRDGQDYRAWFRLENQERFDRIRRKIKEDLDNIKSDQYILEMYLKRPGINMDYEKDTKHRPIIDQKYSTYTRFVDNIRKFRAPVLESSNIDLQNTIEDFLNNTEKVKNVFIFLMNPINVKKNPFSELVGKTTGKESDDLREEAMNYQNRLNTGITIRPSAQEGQPYYEVYIQVNVIGGEVNDDNKSAVDCMYQGESLGDKLARLLNEALYLPWTMNNSRIFFDITTGEAKAQIDKQDKEKKEKEEKEKAQEKEGPKEIAPSEKKMGGKTRKYREWLMKTQKRRESREPTVPLRPLPSF